MPAVTPRDRVRRRPSGFTLIEVMVALVLLGLVVGALLTVVMHQQRFYDSASEVMEVRDNLRRTGDLLPSELRALAPRYGDIYAMSDSAIDFRSATGSSTICEFSNNRTMIIVPPTQLQTDAGLTSWLVRPVMSDSMFIFDSRDAGIDTMIGRGISAAPAAGSCAITSGFTSTSAEVNASVTFLLDSALPPSVPAGAPVRFFRRARYSLYRNPNDEFWYLGYRDFVPGRNPQWSAIQPVAGPLLPYNAQGASGLRFIYRDSAGTVLTSGADAPRVRRIDIEVRARSRAIVRAMGMTTNGAGLYTDSLFTSVALRNH
ncbi:MAG TPA: prepilin-type N-terminal cleavage/methylation domain-containing protein [Gemmatimonadaceae bacterium]|nr:prepilin-type N-terminal cleavage/methylation domain-containing protein [Gemmatimonadaceae bacterium]